MRVLTLVDCVPQILLAYVGNSDQKRAHIESNIEVRNSTF